MEEIWKDILGYEGIYIASSYGRIKSIKPYISKMYKDKTRERILKYRIDTRGYFTVNLYKNKKMKTLSVHRIIIKSFITNFDDKPQVNHIDGVKTNNKIDNLEWCTAKENCVHYYKHIYKGERKGLKHNVKPNVNRTTYKISLENIKTNESINFTHLTQASKFIGKADNYFHNWVHKKRYNYHNKHYRWNIKRRLEI